MESIRTSDKLDISYNDYLEAGFVPLLCKGYNPKYNRGKVYRAAKEPITMGFTSSGYKPPAHNEIVAWEEAGGWTGWVIPKGVIALDVEDPEDVSRVEQIYQEKGISPAIHRTNNGVHFFFHTDQDLPAASKVFTKCGVTVTYRVGGKNYLILAPTNGRTWELWKKPEDLTVLPTEFEPYDRKSIEDVLNNLSWYVHKAHGAGHFGGFEDIDAALMVLLIECGLTDDPIHQTFQVIFGTAYDARQTSTMYQRTVSRREGGDLLMGAGSFIQRAKDQELKEVIRFVRELETVTGGSRITVTTEWPDPIPFDNFSLLPDFPVDALAGIGREMVETVAEVNQVDPALAASIYMGALSACCAKKTRVSLVSHEEPVNLYLISILDSGNRKSSTDAAMTAPLYEYQQMRQDETEPTIRDAVNDRKIKEKRLETLQKRASSEDDFKKRRQLEEEARDVSREIAENSVPTPPTYLVDDITPEKLGDLMADHGERMAVMSAEGGILEIMGGRYDKNGNGNLDLFLKGHAGDPWATHRIGRESKAMRSPALTLCLAVQTGVVDDIGRNNQFRGKGLLARFLYSRCKSQVGYRERQTRGLPPSLVNQYREHIVSLMGLPATERISLSRDGQALWDEFYNDVEKEMRAGESLYYLQDWGSKLPGAVARIAGLLHLAQHGEKGLNLPISVDIVNASCLIGAYFKDHAVAVFNMMREDSGVKLARQILDFLKRGQTEVFQGREVMRHTSISSMEEIHEGINTLLDRGYIREEDLTEGSRMGRPRARRYRVNPNIFEIRKESTDKTDKSL
jgi:hypothetical protein